MEQPCSRCGYISDRPARFCRQCGSQLFIENEATSATTRNYAQQTPPQYAEPQAGYPGYTPGGWAEQTPNTSRLYQPPAVLPYEQTGAPKKNSWVKWVLISFGTFFLLFLLAGVGAVYWASKKVERVVQDAQRDIPVVVDIPEIPVPPNPPDPPGIEFKLDEFRYPGASVVESVKSPFNETVTLSSGDDIGQIKEFYDKKFGEKFQSSPTSIQVEDGDKYVYTSLTHPMLVIAIEPDPSQGGKTKIALTRIKAPIPKIKLGKEIQIN
ncbi:MAG: zinc ribbon domain-containing protein [Acidobacteria bacterium]|nr:zinc ribbon domain-containing protein [Acidobacteriota bacterium]